MESNQNDNSADETVPAGTEENWKPVNLESIVFDADHSSADQGFELTIDDPHELVPQADQAIENIQVQAGKSTEDPSKLLAYAGHNFEHTNEVPADGDPSLDTTQSFELDLSNIDILPDVGNSTIQDKEENSTEKETDMKEQPAVSEIYVHQEDHCTNSVKLEGSVEKEASLVFHPVVLGSGTPVASKDTDRKPSEVPNMNFELNQTVDSDGSDKQGLLGTDGGIQVDSKPVTDTGNLDNGDKEKTLEEEEAAISLDNVVMKDAGEKSDSDSEFDFDLPTPKKQEEGSSAGSKVIGSEKVPEIKSSQNSSVPKPVIEDTPSKIETPAQVTSPDKSTVASLDQSQGAKPVAVIKPIDFQPEEDNTHLSSAKAEWDKVTTIQAGFTDKETRPGPEPTVVKTTQMMSVQELVSHFQLTDYTAVKPNIHTSVHRGGLSALIHFVFGPPKLHRNLHQERDLIFCIAASTLSNENTNHIRTLQTIYRLLTGSKFDCPRFGEHWGEIGFQGNDPATDLRGAGVLGLLHLLYFLRDSKRQQIAHEIYKLSLHPTQNFPFCVMSINMSRVALQALREDVLNKDCNKKSDVVSVVSDFYAGVYLHLFQLWKAGGKTIKDSGFVLKEVEAFAKRNPREILKNLDSYLEKKKSAMVSSDIQSEPGPQNFLSVCDTDAGR